MPEPSSTSAATEPTVRTRYAVRVTRADGVVIFDGAVTDNDHFRMEQVEGKSTTVSLSATAAIASLTHPSGGSDVRPEATKMTLPDAVTREAIARAFHEEYEHLAPSYGYETRRESAVEWPDVPEQNRKLMTHVVGNLLALGVIRAGESELLAGINEGVS